MRILFLLVLVLGTAVPTLAAAQNTRMLTLLSAGKYAEAAAQYKQLYERDHDEDDLFNAAFYSHRAGLGDQAEQLASRYLTETKCTSKKRSTPRRVRHCALAAELTGDLAGALALFEKYRGVARLWAHRSRADGGAERVKLRQALAAAQAENAKLKAAVAKCSPGGPTAPAP